MKNSALSLSILFAFLVTACQPSPRTNKLIVTTLYPQYSIANQLVGDLADVELIIPIASEPHEFEPSPNQRLLLTDADLVLYTSDDFEPWMDAIEESFPDQHLDLSEVVNLIKGEVHEDHTNNWPITYPHQAEDDHDEDYDPHYWLDPTNGLRMVHAISEALIALLPEHQLAIESRLVLLEEAFNETIEFYQGLTIEGEEVDVIFAGHNAFQYLTLYGVHVLTPYPGFSTDVLPTPQSLLAFSNLIQTLNATILYTSSTDDSVVVDVLLEAHPQLRIETLYTIENVSQSQFDNQTAYQELLMLNYEALALSEN